MDKSPLQRIQSDVFKLAFYLRLDILNHSCNSSIIGYITIVLKYPTPVHLPYIHGPLYEMLHEQT
jgi:hypothetical protein